MTLAAELNAFAKANKITGKGPLSIMLVVTDHARKMGFPLDPEKLKAASGTQVLGASGGKVQGILRKHGIDRVLSSEGGRTSRGSLANMEAYVATLNKLNSLPDFDLDAVEVFWVQKVRDFFAGKPFTLRVDASLGMRAIVRGLMEQAEERQKELNGTMVVGTVLQHLVGAKLDVALRDRVQVQHHSANTNDAVARGGDFDLGDASIHVSTTPTEALLRKCQENLSDGLRPIIVTIRKGVALAEGLADNLGILDRIDVLEVEQFVATNVYELGVFDAVARVDAIGDIVTRYNEIVTAHETDPSLKIEMTASRGGKGE